MESSPMNGVSRELRPEEVAEVEQHKYFLSEKAGHDVGWEFAKEDWLARFADTESEGCDAASQSCDSKGVGSFFKRLLSRAAI
jgi:hypothetical protein